MTLYNDLSICLANAYPPHPQPNITSFGLLSFCNFNQDECVFGLKSKDLIILMATPPNVVTKKNLAFIDFEFVILNHENITKDIIKQSIIEGMKNIINNSYKNDDIKFKENGLEISDFIKKGNYQRRIRGWFSCTEIKRDFFLKAITKIMTDKTISKIISQKSGIKATKIHIGQLMIKFSNDFDVEMPSFDNTQNIPDKYLKTHSFRSKSAKIDIDNLDNNKNKNNDKKEENKKEDKKTDD